MNAMEHGNALPRGPARHVRVLSATDGVHVQITDQGQVPPADAPAEEPDLEAKLAGLQRPRGWGLFLIKNMVDESARSPTGERHTLELTMRLRRTTMATLMRPTAVRRRDGVAVIDLLGDVNAAAEDAPRRRLGGGDRRARRRGGAELRAAPATSTRPGSR